MAGYTLLDHKINEKFFQELIMDSLQEKLYTFRNNGLKHVHQMENHRQSTILEYHSIGR
jgi:hypothetical protein